MKLSHDDSAESSRVHEKASAAPPPDLDADLEAGGSSDQTTGDEKVPGGSDTSPDHDHDHDPNVVTWDGPDDPQNPRNWPFGKKVFTIALTSVMAFYIPLASSMFAPAVTEVMVQFGNDNLELASFVVSVFVLGFAFGPILLAPLTEVYGRWGLYSICNVLFFVFTIATAKSNSLGMLTGFRFLAGFVGGMPLAVGGGTITDLMEQEHRGTAMAFFAAGPLLGPVAGPIIGGFLAQAKGWAWCFWLQSILSGVVSLLTVFLMPETYAPTILARKAQRLRKETGNPDLRSIFQDDSISAATLVRHSLERPMKLLIYSPICLGLSSLLAFAFGVLYLLFTTFTMVYEEVYGWGIGIGGLAFLGMGIGSLLGMIVYGSTSDRILAAKARANGEDHELKPEYRLVLLMPGMACLPIGLFWYGWAAEAKTHWIVPILGTVWVGFAFLMCMVSVTSYMMDAFTEYAASAVAAAAVLRSILGGCLPLAGRQMYATLGYGWGTSLLAFISIALLPFPFLFYFYGERMRKRWPVQLK